MTRSSILLGGGCVQQSKQCVLSFGFCRPGALAKSILSINLNYSSSKDYTHILVVDRASKNSKRYPANQKTIEVAHKLLERGFIDNLKVRDEPHGTQRNIINGVSEAAEQFTEIFVVEDDLELIHYHKDLPSIFFNKQLNGPVVAFSTYTNLIKNLRYSTFLSHRFSSQAWGTTAESWSTFDIEYIRNLDLSEALNKDLVRHLGSDMPGVIAGFKSGKIDSWAIPWNIFNFLSGNLMVYPAKSYVLEGGHESGAMRTRGVKFKAELATNFIDVENLMPIDDYQISKAYIGHFSVANRAARKLRSKLWQFCS